MPYKDKQRQLDAQREWRKNRRSRVAELKKGPCVDCNNTFPPECMDFDHEDNEKVQRIAHMVIHSKWENVLTEIAKCQLVCANCHRIRTHSRLQHIPRVWRTT